jgi:UDP-N-acetylglucosamine/UDP-N-acetylgalactosamine diphosphorylase
MTQTGKIAKLLAQGVQIPAPEQVYVAPEVAPENIEHGVVLLPGVVLEGEKTLLGSGTVLGPQGYFVNVRCGRQVKLAAGQYHNCVFLDGARVRGGAEMREGTLFMEEAQAAHTVGCKMTILGMQVTLGSLINFCDVLVTGGSDEPFGFTEIGSGAIHYNFTPNGLKFGSLIGPGALGEMFGLFARTFVGGQTQIISPTIIGSEVLIPAGVAVRSPVADGVIAVPQPLAAGEKPYEPTLLTRVREKFTLTATLLAHYQALYHYFCTVRQHFAQHLADTFLEKLYQAAAQIILQNIQERLSWLFHKKENGVRVDLCARLSESLRLHQQKLSKAGQPELRFLLEQVREHQALLADQESLAQVWQEPLPQLPEQQAFMAQWEDALGKAVSPHYFSFVRGLPLETKLFGKHWLNRLLQHRLAQVSDLLQHADLSSTVAQTLRSQRQLLQPFWPQLIDLYRQGKFLVSGRWQSPQLGLLNRSPETLDYDSSAWELCSALPSDMDSDSFGMVLKIIATLPYPAIIQWPDMWVWLKQVLAQTPCLISSLTIEAIVRRACVRFHGTDGLRGRMVYPHKPMALSESLERFIRHHDVTPELFAGLVRNTVYACRLQGYQVATVLLGRDTRDLAADDPVRMQMFYKAVQQALLSTGVTLADAGELPIAAIPYVMAEADGSLGIYKSASHNPASQDGVKVFLRYKEQTVLGRWGYGKASVALETLISALLFKEAICGPELHTGGRQLEFMPYKAREVFGEIAWRHFQGARWANVGYLVGDLAHGAFASPKYRQIVERLLQATGIAQVELVGDRPNGKNINNNEGEDRVGAAHLENVQEIAPSELMNGGSFYGFPALQRLFAAGEKQPEGSMAWALFVDGDGDRGYAAFYHPLRHTIYIVDGEKALFYMVAQAIHRQQLRPGDSIALTVESSVTFINALVAVLQQICPVQFMLASDKPASDSKINLRITPVGDKYLLVNQCLGVESSGHLIASYQVGGKAVWVGNGLFAALDTIKAFGSSLEKGIPGMPDFCGKSFADRVDMLSNSYPRPCNTTVAIYFVNKTLWYRGSDMWRLVEKIVNESCQYPLTPIFFAEEPDTMYYVALNETQQLRFTILARPSGTENKMSIKLYGSEATQEWFATLSEQIFQQLAPRMKEAQGQTYQDQCKILRYLAEQGGRGSVAELLRQFMKQDLPYEKAYWLMLVESLSDKGDKMAHYDGVSLALNARGKIFLERLEKT